MPKITIHDISYKPELLQMEISELTLKLILLFIPGAIAMILIEQLTIHHQWSSFKFVVGAIILGCISYCILQLVFFIPWIHLENRMLEFWTSMTNTERIPYLEILFASSAGFMIGLITTAAIQNKWIFKLAQTCKISYKYGDESLYYFFLNARNISEVHLRDFEQNLTFHGYIQGFSESEHEREIVLRSVDVYQLDTSELLYKTDAIFLSKPKALSWQIELPTISSDNQISTCYEENSPKSEKRTARQTLTGRSTKETSGKTSSPSTKTR